MVGYDLEDRAWCLEITYNYGLNAPYKYTPGNGLKEFGICVPDVPKAFEAAQRLGYASEDGVIIGPEGYRFRVLAMPEGRSEHFLYALCRVADISKSVAFYKDFLGMSDAAVPSEIPGLPAKAAAVSYTSSSHPHGREPVLFVLYEDGIKPQLTPWEGRNAVCIPADDLRKLYTKVKSEQPNLIMHEGDGGNSPIELNDQLGILLIFILRDPDGYELCVVSRETMLPLTVQAVTNYDPKSLDHEARDKRIAGIAAAGKEVEALISQKPVVVFSKEWCPFCRKAKAALDDIGATYVAKELEGPGKEPLVDSPLAFQEYLGAMTNLGKSVPKVFIKGKCIGGGDDVVAMHKTGQLLAACASAGAAKAAATLDRADTNTHYFVNGRPSSREDYEKAAL